MVSLLRDRGRVELDLGFSRRDRGRLPRINGGAYRLIPHLQPPGGCGRIWMERFSPYYAQREAFPVGDVRPEPSYAHIYPRHVVLDRIAYFFEYTMGDTVAEEAHAESRAIVQEWKRRWKSD